MNILMISDDREYRGLLKEILQERRNQVEIVEGGYEGIEKSKEKEYDLIIIDIHKDKLSVVQVLEMLMFEDKKARVMVVKEEEDENEELHILKLGAREYLSKKKSFNIVMERIRKIVTKEKEDIIVAESKEENIIIEIDSREVRKDNIEITLTNYEYELLLYMIMNKNKLLTRQEIYKDVWKIEEERKDMRSVDTYVKNLRKKMGIKIIKSSRGIGYRWCEK